MNSRHGMSSNNSSSKKVTSRKGTILVYSVIIISIIFLFYGLQENTFEIIKNNSMYIFIGILVGFFYFLWYVFEMPAGFLGLTKQQKVKSVS